MHRGNDRDTPPTHQVDAKIDRDHFEEASATRVDDHKIRLDESVVGAAGSAHDIMRGAAIGGVLSA